MLYNWQNDQGKEITIKFRTEQVMKSPSNDIRSHTRKTKGIVSDNGSFCIHSFQLIE